MKIFKKCWFCQYKMHKDYQYWVNIKKLAPEIKKSVKVCKFCKDQLKSAISSKCLKYENQEAGSWTQIDYRNY